MRIRNAIVLLLAVFVGAGLAQGDKSVAVFTGYTMTAFEDQGDAAGTLPIGVQFGYQASPNVVVGAEVTNALGGFTWKGEELGLTFETTYNYTIVAAFAKYLLSQNDLKPYLKGGLGYFLGDADVKVSYEGESETEKAKIDPAIGFIIGAGVDFNQKFFGEFNYNIVSRKSGESDNESSKSFGMNTWAVKVGYRMSL